MDPHSFFADPDPAVILNKDPEPAFKKIVTNYLKKFSGVEKDKNDCSKLKSKKNMELVQIYFYF